MIKRSTNSSDLVEGTAPKIDSWSRPLAVQYLGWALLLGAMFLILGGAYRMQSNMITSGLLFLAMGVIFVPDTLRKGWPIKLGLGTLAIIGAVYTFLT